MPYSGNNSGQVVHTRASVTSCIILYQSRAGDTLRLRRIYLDMSGFTLAMHHRLQWFIHLRIHGLKKGDEQPVQTRHRVWQTFTFLPFKYTLPICMVIVQYQFFTLTIINSISYYNNNHLTASFPGQPG